MCCMCILTMFYTHAQQKCSSHLQSCFTFVINSCLYAIVSVLNTVYI